MATQAKPATLDQTSFLLRRLHSLSGVAPIGIFLLYHMYFALYAWQGAAVYNAKMADLRATPNAYGYLAFEMLFIYIPILFHGIYGLFITKDARINLNQYRLFGNLTYLLQRLSGVGLLLFIAAHVWNARLMPMIAGSTKVWEHVHEGFSYAHSGMMSFVTISVYILGTAGAAFHLANGLWLFAIRWGLVTGETKMKTFRVWCLGFYGLLQVWVLVAMAGFMFGGKG